MNLRQAVLENCARLRQYSKELGSSTTRYLLWAGWTYLISSSSTVQGTPTPYAFGWLRYGYSGVSWPLMRSEYTVSWKSQYTHPSVAGSVWVLWFLFLVRLVFLCVWVASFLAILRSYPSLSAPQDSSLQTPPQNWPSSPSPNYQACPD